MNKDDLDSRGSGVVVSDTYVVVNWARGFVYGAPFYSDQDALEHAMVVGATELRKNGEPIWLRPGCRSVAEQYAEWAKKEE